MWIEQPPLFYRLLFPEALWRIQRRGRKVVYLTFDDGPIPEETPWVLDLLDKYGIKATFFMVGDNVRRHPELFEEIKRRGHSYGNHTMHHLQGIKESATTYLRDITEADALILVTRDYSKRINGEQVLDNVKRYVRNGSIIVFHDSIKAHTNMRYALPRAIEWLKEQGYEFEPLPM